VNRLFASQALTDFGPCALAVGPQAPPVYLVHGPRPSELRRRVRESCPCRPGVYGMVDQHGELIYVGKAKVLRARLLSYFRPRSRDKKAGRIIAQTCTLLWEPNPSEFAALHRELELIRRWRPRFNVQGQPRAHRYTYVCLGRRPAPYVFLTRRPPAEVIAAFGPVPAGKRASQAIRRLNDWFGLRDCPQAQEMVFADQGNLFPMLHSAGCLRYEIGTCLGPCTAGCTRQQYAARVQAVQAFLDGKNVSPLQILERDMAAAAASQAYERAAVLRDRLEALRWLFEQLDQVRRLRADGSFIYPVTGHDGSVIWYLVHHGRTVAAVTAPHDEASRQAAAERIEAVYKREETRLRLESAEHLDGMLLLAAWFRRHPEERALLHQPVALATGTLLRRSLPDQEIG
jgi:excinuclease ABC subunit C